MSTQPITGYVFTLEHLVTYLEGKEQTLYFLMGEMVIYHLFYNYTMYMS